jgi:hypothetical protein
MKIKYKIKKYIYIYIKIYSFLYNWYMCKSQPNLNSKFEIKNEKRKKRKSEEKNRNTHPNRPMGWFLCCRPNWIPLPARPIPSFLVSPTRGARASVVLRATDWLGPRTGSLSSRNPWRPPLVGVPLQSSRRIRELGRVCRIMGIRPLTLHSSPLRAPCAEAPHRSSHQVLISPSVRENREGTRRRRGDRDWTTFGRFHGARDLRRGSRILAVAGVCSERHQRRPNCSLEGRHRRGPHLAVAHPRHCVAHSVSHLMAFGFLRSMFWSSRAKKWVGGRPIWRSPAWTSLWSWGHRRAAEQGRGRLR